MASSNGRSTLSERVAVAETKLEQHDDKIVSLETKLDDLTAIRESQVRTEGRLDGIETHIDSVEEKVDAINSTTEKEKDVKENNKNQIRVSVIATLISTVVSVVAVLLIAFLK